MRRELTVEVEHPVSGDAVTLHLDRIYEDDQLFQVWTEIRGQEPVLLRDGLRGRAKALSVFSVDVQMAMFQRLTREG